MHRTCFVTMMFGGLLHGCEAGGLAGTGNVHVFVAAEDTITDGLAPGTELENIVDGWEVHYSKFVIAVGNFRARRSADSSDRISLPEVRVFDLTRADASGVAVGAIDDVTAARWDKVGFDIPNASGAAVQDPSVADEDYAALVDGGFSLMISGSLSNLEGQSCPPGAADCIAAPRIDFTWSVAAGTSFDDCAPEEGDSGFAVPSGGTVQVKPTIHGDHWFFSNITEGVELTERRAQWIADCDLDGDGVTTMDELMSVAAEDVFPSATYSLTNPFGPIETAWDYFAIQARTLGDFQGEGECPTRTPL